MSLSGWIAMWYVIKSGGAPYNIRKMHTKIISHLQDLDQRDEFSKSFREANIDGLHLLELTSAEMTG